MSDVDIYQPVEARVQESYEPESLEDALKIILAAAQRMTLMEVAIRHHPEVASEQENDTVNALLNAFGGVGGSASARAPYEVVILGMLHV